MMELTEIPHWAQQEQRRPPGPWGGGSFLIPHTHTHTIKWSSSSNGNGNGNGCMEQLLVHCAEAIESSDATPAQQILWVLNNIAPPDGDSTQRLTSAFLRALILRAARSSSNSSSSSKLMTLLSSAMGRSLSSAPHRFSLLQLAHFVDLTPSFRFGFTAANSLILASLLANAAGNDATAITSSSSAAAVHIVDVGTTHCMQIPTLIDAIATHFAALGRLPPLVRLTVAALTHHQVPPVFDVLSYDELGLRLTNFARSRNIALDFKAVPTSPSDAFFSLLDAVRQQQEDSSRHGRGPETLIVNCQLTLHHLPLSVRGIFLESLRRLSPALTVVVEEDVDLTSEDLVSRLRAAFNYLWIPFDTADTFLVRGSREREWYEADVCWKIESVVAGEGGEGERQETRPMWARRMERAGFRGVGLGDEAAAEVRRMLEEHAAGWGSKREEEDLVLTWKGHNVVFASAWVPT